jgi:hypothetical protein
MPELIDREQAGKNICKYCASDAYCKEDDCMVYQGLRDTPTIQTEAEPVLSKSELREAAMRIREHNRIHSRAEPRAIFITRYLDVAATVLEKIADGEIVLLEQEVGKDGTD